jgi:hypothetical protein
MSRVTRIWQAGGIRQRVGARTVLDLLGGQHRG